MISAVIVAAGSSKRMGSGTDKLFLQIRGQPLVAHTWRRFDACQGIDEIVLVIREGMEPAFREIAAVIRARKPFRFARGGPERQDSVWNGIADVSPECEIVAIQDGARPCTPDELIMQAIGRAREFGAAVVAHRVSDTLKEGDATNLIKRTVDRSNLWAVQTPQVFHLEVIRKAMQAVRDQGLILTDDTSACELIGQTVALVESAAPNPKVTSPGDIPYIEWLLCEHAAANPAQAISSGIV
ncbi:MAG: 2-C-methyl-D-erythritol 4-phosphate cytidylyltransferase [Verrucomicrobia bacterium]|nr:2-C-methyl-D-erythritol 4-phosphate cytidylyltransferase [Verrucomicrobiota bacterium]